MNRGEEYLDSQSNYYRTILIHSLRSSLRHRPSRFSLTYQGTFSSTSTTVHDLSFRCRSRFIIAKAQRAKATSQQSTRWSLWYLNGWGHHCTV